MAILHRKSLYHIILPAVFLSIASISNAQSLTVPVYASNAHRISGIDSSLTRIAAEHPAVITASAGSNTAEITASKRGNMLEQERLMGYLKALNVTEDQQQALPNKKFYYHLAGIFARLKLYPLAMKCFLKTAAHKNEQIIDERSAVDTLEIDSAALTANSKDDAIVADQIALTNKVVNSKSKATNSAKIWSNFNDGKPAAAYALLFHVKQPVPGKRKIFVWGNTGHTFITLIKYNKDSTSVSASFGFYPKKDQPLSATPVFPTTSSTFKDDAGHGWDEVIGKFISKRKFERILKLTKDFDGIKYNLNNRNCTDFGLQAAELAGISITGTSGKWPMGQGNNPAITGQSLLMGKVINMDGSADSGLFKTDLVKQ